jgi:tetrahydromethanopterin S-methyltransferase subunit E
MARSGTENPRRDRGASAAALVEKLWLPVALGLVLGATIASVVHGSVWKQLAVGTFAGGWVTICLAGYLALYDRWLGHRGDRTGRDEDRAAGR